MRFYLVDRITKMDLGEKIEGQKCWSMTDSFLEQHFPGFPIVPGVLIIESMAQLLGTLIEKSHIEKFKDDHGVYAVLSIVHKAKFKSFLIPGDKAEMVGTISTLDKAHGNGAVTVTVDGKVRAKAELSFVLLSKKELPNNRLSEMRDEYFNTITQGMNLREQTTR